MHSPLDRRTFMLTSGAAAVAALAPRMAFAQTGTRDAELNALFEKIFQQAIDDSPEFATALGLDKGARAAAKSKLDDNSAAGRKYRLGRAQQALREVNAFKGANISEASQINRDVIAYLIEQQTIPAARFDLDSVQRPYRIFQQGGAYFETPDFLNSNHVINAAADCEAYLARLETFAINLDRDTEVQKAQAARGYVAPSWSLDLTLGQIAKLRGGAPESSAMVESLARRAAEKNIAGDWRGRATKILKDKIYPALDRQIALLKQLRATTAAGDGIWRVPRGDEIYAAALSQATTTALTPDEVHKMGLEEVARINSELDKILKAQGRSQGEVGARLAALNADPSQLYPDTAAGRTELIAGLNADNNAMQAKLAQAFVTVPNIPLEIRAVPVEIQDGASNGYYNPASLDGTRPAIYFINLKSVGDWPKYSLPSLTYHEGVPGHHYQNSISQVSGDLPMLRKISFLSAHGEGWALYAEQLADELKGYDNALERAGYLQSFLFRAARLVVDTGIHTKKWTREQATDYMVKTTGFAQPRSQREVERYCTQPGQACSYKVGHAMWVKAREDAQKALGAKFDLKQFHEVLKDGPMPLSMLEQRVKARTAAAMKAG